jgi:hypothetical protein
MKRISADYTASQFRRHNINEMQRKKERKKEGKKERKKLRIKSLIFWM